MIPKKRKKIQATNLASKKGRRLWGRETSFGRERFNEDDLIRPYSRVLPRFREGNSHGNRTGSQVKWRKLLAIVSEILRRAVYCVSIAAHDKCI